MGNKKKSGKRKRLVSDIELESTWNRCFSKIYHLPFNHINLETCLTEVQLVDYFNFINEEKVKLFDVKSSLNHIDIAGWHSHTSHMHECGHITYSIKTNIKGELVTQAWSKFYTILNNFPDIVKTNNFSTLHLCEAPGAFITSLNHYIQNKFKDNTHINWKWSAATLNPYYEGNEIGKMLIDDRLIIETLSQWDFTDDFTGDVMCRESLEYYINKYKDQPIDLITADGSIDCSENPGQQELLVLPLFLWETITALSVLAETGCFVMKIFTIFEKETLTLLYLLWLSFKQVTLFKPGPSKAGNSEVYVVCVNFMRKTCHSNNLFSDLKKNALLDCIKMNEINLIELPKTFFNFLQSYVIQSCLLQSQTIRYNLATYYDTYYKRTIAIRKYISSRFISQYEIYEITNYVAPLLMLGNNLPQTDQPYKIGSYDNRLKQNDNEVSKNYTSNELKCVNNKIFYRDVNMTVEELKMNQFIYGKKFDTVKYSSFCSFIALKQYNEAMKSNPSLIAKVCITTIGSLFKDQNINQFKDQTADRLTDHTRVQSKDQTIDHLADHAKITDHTADHVTDHTADQVTDHTTDQVTNHTADQVTDHTADQVTNHTADQATNHTADQVTDHTADLVTNHTAEQVTNHTADHVTDHTADQATNHTADQVTDHTADQVTNHTADQVTNHTAEQVTNHTADQVTNHTADRVTNSTADQVTNHTADPLDQTDDHSTDQTIDSHFNVHIVCPMSIFQELNHSTKENSNISYFHLQTKLGASEIDQNENILLLFIEISKQTNKLTNMKLIEIWVENITLFKCFTIQTDCIVLTNYWAGILLLLSTLFKEMTYNITSGGEIYFKFHEHLNNVEDLEDVKSHIAKVIEELNSMENGRDILFVTPIYTLMKSVFRNYLRQQNHFIINKIKNEKDMVS